MILTLQILSAFSFHKYTHHYQITINLNILVFSTHLTLNNI